MMVCLSRYLSVHHNHPSIDHYIAESNTWIKAEVKGAEKFLTASYFNVHHISSLQKIVSIVKNRSNLKVIDMILFPEDDILIREIESWKGFADTLYSEDRRLFLQMLNDCHRYSNAINAKGEPFPAEALLMTLVFIQHKMISWLIKYQYKKLK